MLFRCLFRLNFEDEWANGHLPYDNENPLKRRVRADKFPTFSFPSCGKNYTIPTPPPEGIGAFLKSMKLAKVT